MALTARELAEFIGAKLLGDDSVVVSGVAAPESAGPQDLIYFDSPRYQIRAQNSAAKCVLAPLGLPLKDKTTLEVENPKLAFAKASVRLLPNYLPSPGIHPSD
jgi:UDP-3-O-[3-hydroxymyristoyl] glucosamine N-acyltransferase